MTTALQDLQGKQANVYTLMTQYLDDNVGALRTELKAVQDSGGEVKQTIERMQAELNTISTEIKKQMVLANRPGTLAENDAKALESKAAFNKALRKGPKSLSNEERKYVRFDEEEGIQTKALYGADATTGGFLAVPEYVNDLIKAIVLISPMRQIVDVRETNNPYVMIPKRTQTASAYRVAEQATRTESQNPKFGLVQVFPYEAAALALISRTDLDDSALDLGEFIMQEFAEQFAKLEGAELINGDGNAKAFGFMNDSTVTVGAITGTSGALDYASFPKLMHSLKTVYRQRATWVMTTETLGAVRQLTDTVGRPLWQPFGAGNLPDTLFGYPYVEMPDMPQIANSAKPIAFGDFKRGYQMVIRKQVSIQVLTERYADQNLIGYLGYYRFGGTVKLGEAIKLMQCHS